MLGRILFFLFLVIPSYVHSQTVLDRYIREGLERNLALQQREFSYRKSCEALNEARGMFFPSIGILARYSRAGGGRIIEFPVGDLLNPVYTTLNQLLAAQGLPPGNFPYLANETIPFLREEEQETKIRLVQQIFRPSVYYNYRIKSDLSTAQAAERDAYRRRLVADIKTGYYNYLKALKLVDLLRDTQKLLEENLRVSEALFDAGTVTEDAVFRARAEISELEQMRAGARRDRGLAESYFNFLLNRPFDATIEVPSEEPIPNGNDFVLEEIQRAALERREEMVQVHSAWEASKNGVRLATARYLPSIHLVLDYGIQGEYYRFSREDDFWMGSLLLEWSLFDGMQRKAQRDRSIFEEKRLEACFRELENQIRLEIQHAYEELVVTGRQISSARDRVSSARKSFRIISRKYENGMSPHVEYLDARNSLTGAEINLVIATYDYHIAYAELERVAALGNYGE